MALTMGCKICREVKALPTWVARIVASVFLTQLKLQVRP